MLHREKLQSKIHTLDTLRSLVTKWKSTGLEVVFTNGCFDLLHRGHVDYLNKAADLGDRLIVALNTDASVKKLKGAHRPLQDENTRMEIMAALECVDAVFLFDEETPLEVITQILPDILVKGSDYTVDTIVGAEVVMEHGGEVRTIEFLPGYSTSAIERKIKEQ